MQHIEALTDRQPSPFSKSFIFRHVLFIYAQSVLNSYLQPSLHPFSIDNLHTERPHTETGHPTLNLLAGR